MTNAQRQVQFVPLFAVATVFDTLAGVAVASKHEVWSHISFLWSGPLDNIVFGIAGLQAALFLLDPEGEKVLDQNGEPKVLDSLKLAVSDSETQTAAARRFLDGATGALFALGCVVASALLAGFLSEGPWSLGLLDTAQRHLASLLPIAVVLGAVISFFRLGVTPKKFLPGCLLGALVFLIVALSQGRVDNYLYHLAANLESLHAWALALGWSGVMAVKGLPKRLAAV